MTSAYYTEIKQETDLLAKHEKILLMFQDLWTERARAVKDLCSKKDSSEDLLRVNRAETRLIRLIESSEINQKDNLEKIKNQAPTELKVMYDQFYSIAISWFSVIGVHKNFLEVEKEKIPLFMYNVSARKKYFESLNSTLTIYSQIIKKHDKEKIIGQNIMAVSKNKISGLPSTTTASFFYGMYRIVAATAVGTLIFGDKLPGGELQLFILWSLHVNIAGTIISFADMKLETAAKIKNAAEEIFYYLKPTFSNKSLLIDTKPLEKWLVPDDTVQEGKLVPVSIKSR